MGTITFTGTVSPWLFNGSNYFLGTLIDTNNFFGGGILTNDPFTTTWISDATNPTVFTAFTSATLTINGISVEFASPAALNENLVLNQSSVEPGVTISLFPHISLNSFIYSNHPIFPNDLSNFSYTFNPLTDNLSFPHQLGGAFHLNGLNGYLAVQTVSFQGYAIPVVVVPAPIAGTGPIALILLMTLAFLARKHQIRYSR